MAKTKMLFLLLIMLVVTGCGMDRRGAQILTEEAYPVPSGEKGNHVAVRAMVTAPPFTPQPTAIYAIPTATHTVPPSFEQNYAKTLLPTVVPMMTPGPDRSPDLMLPGNLKLEEFPMREGDISHVIWEQILARHPERGEHIVLPYNSEQRWVDGPATLEHVYRPKSKILVKWEGHPDTEIICTEQLVYPFHSFTYTSGHWYLGSLCPDDVSVFMDGVSLNGERGYDLSIGFQMMNGQPLYLYQKDNTVGIFYGGAETLLPYNRLVYGYCEGCYPPPNHFERMITFAAFAGEQLYYVAIGQFEN